MKRLTLASLAACLLLSLSACTDEMIITDPNGTPTTPNGAPEPSPIQPGKNSLPPAHLSKQPPPVRPGQNSLPPVQVGKHSLPPPPAPVAGGYSVANPDDQNLFQIIQFVEKELYARDGKEVMVKKLLKAEKQVVAGTNYRLTLLMNDGQRYQAVVYEDLQGAVDLTSYRRI